MTAPAKSRLGAPPGEYLYCLAVERQSLRGPVAELRYLHAPDANIARIKFLAVHWQTCRVIAVAEPIAFYAPDDAKDERTVYA